MKLLIGKFAVVASSWVLANCLFAGEPTVQHPTVDHYTQPAMLTNVVLKPALERLVCADESPPKQTTGDRWVKFESEFGIQQPDSSLVFGTLQNAKYQLDWTTFALHEFAENVADRFRFNVGLCDFGLAPRSSKPPRVVTDNFLDDALYNLRLKTVIDLNAGEKSFIGLKLSVPIGD